MRTSVDAIVTKFHNRTVVNPALMDSDGDATALTDAERTFAERFDEIHASTNGIEAQGPFNVDVQWLTSARFARLPEFLRTLKRYSWKLEQGSLLRDAVIGAGTCGSLVFRNGDEADVGGDVTPMQAGVFTLIDPAMDPGERSDLLDYHGSNNDTGTLYVPFVEDADEIARIAAKYRGYTGVYRAASADLMPMVNSMMAYVSLLYDPKLFCTPCKLWVPPAGQPLDVASGGDIHEPAHANRNLNVVHCLPMPLLIICTAVNAEYGHNVPNDLDLAGKIFASATWVYALSIGLVNDNEESNGIRFTREFGTTIMVPSEASLVDAASFWLNEQAGILISFINDYITAMGYFRVTYEHILDSSNEERTTRQIELLSKMWSHRDKALFDKYCSAFLRHPAYALHDTPHSFSMTGAVGYYYHSLSRGIHSPYMTPRKDPVGGPAKGYAIALKGMESISGLPMLDSVAAGYEDRLDLCLKVNRACKKEPMRSMSIWKYFTTHGPLDELEDQENLLAERIINSVVAGMIDTEYEDSNLCGSYHIKNLKKDNQASVGCWKSIFDAHSEMIEEMDSESLIQFAMSTSAVKTAERLAETRRAALGPRA